MTSPKSRGKCKSTTVQQQPENRVIDIKATSIMHSDLCPYILQIHGATGTGNYTVAALLGAGKKY